MLPTRELIIAEALKLTSKVKKNDSNLRLMLTTSILFAYFEILQGNREQASAHATQGYGLLRQFVRQPNSQRWEIGACAIELDQLSLLMRRWLKGSNSSDSALFPGLENIEPIQDTTFIGLEEARESLQQILNQLTTFYTDMELDDDFYDLAVTSSERHLYISPWLKSWERAFTSLLLQTQIEFSPEDRRIAMILKAHHLMAEILANVDLTPEGGDWDSFHNTFRAIVDLATAVLEDGTRNEQIDVQSRWQLGDPIPATSLSFSFDLIDPLYEVCARCKDPIPRRQALSLLARHPRPESVWSSWSAWKIGDFLMQCEEYGEESFEAMTPLRPPPGSAIMLGSEADTSMPLAQTGSLARPTALVRATARYKLNSGLFTEWSILRPDGAELVAGSLWSS